MRVAFAGWLAFLVSGNVHAAQVVCSRCHPNETALFLKSPMGRSLTRSEWVGPGRVEHEVSGSSITITEKKRQMIHTLTERGLTAEFPVAYQIGAGTKGRSYVVRIGDYLLESPASWYKGRGWDVSPGFESLKLLDFDRPITSECLFCHAGNVQFADVEERRLATDTVAAITCERCHGPATEHIRQPSSKNIVNPPKLPAAARDSVCEQCHLEGETRVLNPGARWQDFHAGGVLERVAVAYRLRSAETGRAVTQAEQLAESKCARASEGKLWCGSCHHPHRATVDREREIRAVCVSCHPVLTKAAHPSPQKDCAGCHMPSRPTTDIAHVSATDHRIQRPNTSVPRYEGPDVVTAWREPAPELRTRDLGVAEVQIGLERKLPRLVQQGYDLLRNLPMAQLGGDAEVFATLETVTAAFDASHAVGLARHLVELRPESAAAAEALAVALKASGNVADAEREFRRAIDLDPSLMDAYAQLALLLDEQNRGQESRDVIARFLKWNPQSIQFRMARTK